MAVSQLLRATATGLNFPAAGTTGASLPINPYNSVILGDSPVGFWDYNGTDLTGRGNNATLTASPGTLALPNGDLAMTFNGTTQYAMIATQPIFSPATAANGGNTGILCVEAWVAPAVLTFPSEESDGYVHWAGKGDESTAEEWTCRMYGADNTASPYRGNRTSGYCYLPSGGIGVGAYFQDTLTVGQFFHYTLVINTQNTSPTYPGGYVTIYKNGVKRNTQSLASLSIVPSYGTQPVKIGTRDGGSFFEGAVGKFALYSYEPSQAQITAHYNAMFSSSAFLYTVADGSTASAAGGANTGWSYSISSGWSFTGSPVLSGLSIGPGGLPVSASNTTVESCLVTGQLTVASGGNVSGTVISNCVITQLAGGGGSGIKLGGGSSYVASGTVISGCTISGADAAANRLGTGILDNWGTATGTVVSQNNIYWCRTGMNLTTGTVYGNYVHDPGYISGDEPDCILSPGSAGASSYAAGLNISGNTLLNSLSGGSVVNLAGTSSACQYVTIAGNLLGGGGYTVHGGGTAGSNITVTGNRFSQAYSATSGTDGPVTAFDYTTGSSTWAGNVIHDTGAPVALPSSLQPGIAVPGLAQPGLLVPASPG